MDTMDSGFFTSPSGSPVEDMGSSAEYHDLIITSIAQLVGSKMRWSA